MVRVVLNTPVQVSEGCIAYVASRNLTLEDLSRVQILFSKLGMAEQVPEKMMDAITALTVMLT